MKGVFTFNQGMLHDLVESQPLTQYASCRLETPVDIDLVLLKANVS